MLLTMLALASALGLVLAGLVMAILHHFKII